MKVIVLLFLLEFTCFSLQNCRHGKIEDGIHAIDKWWAIGMDSNVFQFGIRCNDISLITVFNFVTPSYTVDIRDVFIGERIRETILTSYALKDITKVGGMKLNKNSIKSIEKGVFSSFENILEISLKDNCITSLPDDLFISNTKLTIVDLSHNTISAVENATFHFSTIKYLNLGHNRLQKLDFELPQTLINLNLSSNQISHISANFFTRLSNLSIVTLEDNLLQVFPIGCFRSLHNLNHLFLSNNKIYPIPPGTFDSLQGLKTLQIANNSIHDLSGLTTHFLCNLESLHLENNTIAEIDVQTLVNVFRKLEHLYISGNPFNCTYLLKLLTTFAEKGVTLMEGSEYLKDNIKGIACHPLRSQIKKINELVDKQKEDILSQPIFVTANASEIGSSNNENLILSRIHVFYVFIALILIVLLAQATCVFYIVYLNVRPKNRCECVIRASELNSF